MKKNLIYCIALSFILWETAGENVKFSLFDFFKGYSSSQVHPDEEKKPSSAGDENIQDEPVGISERVSVEPESNLAIEQKPEENLSEEIVETPKREPKINELPISSFNGITSVRELLKDIQMNLDSLTLGRMSNEDYEKVLQRRESINSAARSFVESSLAYDKIKFFEKILMEYNAVCEVCVYFLPNMDVSEIHKIQGMLISSELCTLKEELTYTFKTDIDEKLKTEILKFQETVKDGNLTDLLTKIRQNVLKIPRELLDIEQKSKVERLLQEVDLPISGNFRDKCNTLREILQSYNEVRTEPLKLRKINQNEIKGFVSKIIDDVFFENMINTLHIMEEENYSDTAEDDEEVLASRNIKKALFFLLGGISSGGEEQPGSLEQFRNSKSLKDKQNLLKESIAKFNKAVRLFKEAYLVLKQKGVTHKIKNLDEILPIDEDIDRIFKKISIYENLNEDDGN